MFFIARAANIAWVAGIDQNDTDIGERLGCHRQISVTKGTCHKVRDKTARSIQSLITSL
jgi:hypothetical protein